MVENSFTARIGRILRESGWFGIFIRPPIRLGISSGHALSEALRSLFGRVPPQWMTGAAVSRRLARNAELRDRHAGRRCFILGNGPSLAKEPIDLLRGEIVFTLNQGYQFTQSRGIVSTYHAAIDPVLQTAPYAGFLDDLIRLSDDQGTVLLLSSELADDLRAARPDITSFETYQYLITDYAKRPTDQLPNLCHAQLGYISVVHMAIHFALFMGFSQIYLLGCDMDFFIEPERTFDHSYGRGKFGSDDGKTALELFGMDQVRLTEWCLREFRAFAELGCMAEARGQDVWNAGQGGALNVFRRTSLGALFPSREGGSR